jgi:tRNA pseudouridine55 synthase
MSSADVVRRVQNYFSKSKLFEPAIEAQKALLERESSNQKQKRKKLIKKAENIKIGHGGTLDPLATGVLILGIGIGTKDLGRFLECTKSYETTILFGAATDSYDRLGKVLKVAPHSHITEELVKESLEPFRGQTKQIPPIFSALHIQGKRAYEYARAGEELPEPIKPRAVNVTQLELVEFLESGKHSHKAPVEEAPIEEKRFAEKVFADNAPPGNKRFAKRKRTRSLSGEVDAFAVENNHGISAKKTKAEDNAVMSGAIPDTELVTAVGKETILDQSEINDSTTKTKPATTLERNFDEPLKMRDTAPPAAIVRMTVTSGFYVRSLCQDLGEAVGSAALMAELVRTRQERFELGKNVLEYTDLEKGEAVWGPKVEKMLDEWKAWKVEQS